MSSPRRHSAPGPRVSGTRASGPRVLFACGGTGGHVYPAIAIADALRDEAPDVAIAFAGTRDRMEWEAVPKAGYPIHAVTVTGFPRALSPKLLAFPFKLLKGVSDSWTLIGGFDPDVVVGTGGYVAGPVGFAANLRGVPLAIQEQNAYAGATNKLLAKVADRVFIAFEAAKDYFPAEKCVLTGNPVRADLAEADPAAARAHFDIAEGQRVLLAMGGSLGAGPINDALRTNLDALLADESLSIVWQTGRRYFADLKRQVPDHPRLRLLEYLDRMDFAYAAADLAVCRAGAITCSELAVTGTPSVLVPSPNVTADHQTKNAAALASQDAAVLLPEPRLAAEFLTTVQALLNHADRLAAMHTAALAIARPDAAHEIAREVLALAAQSKEGMA